VFDKTQIRENLKRNTFFESMRTSYFTEVKYKGRI